LFGDPPREARQPPRWLVLAVALGLYLSLRGYHSFDGDQAYRLPLLLHAQDSRLFARAFDSFNPHRGYLNVLDMVTRPLGLALGLFVVFVFTFGATCAGVDRLARGTWPNRAPGVGLVALGLVLAGKAGNVGTNHLFEAIVLDRLMAFALGWLALAQTVAQPARARWRASAAVAAATLIHPSVGLQFAMVLGGSWAAWLLLGRWTDTSARAAIGAVAALAAAVLPGLAVNLAPGSSLTGSMPADVFWLLSVELQSPQHMLPHLWRMPQWLACGCYLALAAVSLTSPHRAQNSAANESPDGAPDPLTWPTPRRRLVVTLGVILAGLAAAWYAIEIMHQVRVTIFQPFRMATLARGIALILVAGRLVALWRSGGWLGRMRAVVIATSFTGDWLLVVVTAAELAVSTTASVRERLLPGPSRRIADAFVFFAMLSWGCNFLAHHDTEYGHIPLLGSLAVGGLVGLWGRLRKRAHPASSSGAWTVARWRAVIAAAWLVPVAAVLAAMIPMDRPLARHPLVQGLKNRCRFWAVPNDDVERLALWCRAHTPASARFIGPPGPKTFRLWSARSLAFNRAASPYHAAGLADWFARFQDHVDFHGNPADFVRAYQADRHGFEARYMKLDDQRRVVLALRQGATHVIAAAPTEDRRGGARDAVAGPLELLHVEGQLAVYGVRAAELAQRQR
jgi:hypothetical protein